MNTVIHALWKGDDASPLILPGSIPLSVASVNAELTQYLPDSWKSIIDADVAGPHSVPSQIDLEKSIFGQRSVTKRLARTVFFGAAPTIDTAHKGLETTRVFLGTAVPGDTPGNFHSALTQLSDRATYFYTSAGKYWYDTHANITRRAKDAADRLHREDVWAEIVERLAEQKRHPGSFAGVHVAPEDSADIPDLAEARLVIMHPKAVHKRGDADSSALAFATLATEHRGTANRTYRNMIVFLAADADRLQELETATRNFLGWKHVHDNADDLDLTGQQKRQAADRMGRESQTVQDRLLGAYQWVLTPEMPDPQAPFQIKASRVEGQAVSLAERVSRKLGNEGLLSTDRAAPNIRLDLDRYLADIWEDRPITVGELWDLYARYPYMARLRDRSVLDDGIRRFTDVMFWERDSFAIAVDYDNHSHEYRGLTLPTESTVRVQVNDQLLLVRPAAAEAQREQDQQAVSTAPGGAELSTPAGDADEPASPRVRFKRRYFGVKELNPERYAVDFKKINDEILTHLTTNPGIDLHVRLEIDATAPEGFDEDKVRTVSENANTLKFEQSGFEVQ
jgi:hypothetical protein